MSYFSRCEIFVTAVYSDERTVYSNTFVAAISWNKQWSYLSVFSLNFLGEDFLEQIFKLHQHKSPISEVGGGKWIFQKKKKKKKVLTKDTDLHLLN